VRRNQCYTKWKPFGKNGNQISYSKTLTMQVVILYRLNNFFSLADFLLDCDLVVVLLTTCNTSGLEAIFPAILVNHQRTKKNRKCYYKHFFYPLKKI